MNKLIIVSGNSGGGKTSIMRSLMGNEREVVSVTTRAPRAGEVDGVDYYFIPDKEYDRLVENNALVEKASYGDARYGITKLELFSKLKYDHAFVIVTHDGFVQLTEQVVNDKVSIFLYNKFHEQFEALSSRGDRINTIQKRLDSRESEIADGRRHYDYFLWNKYGNMQESKEIVNAILKTWTGRSYL